MSLRFKLLPRAVSLVALLVSAPLFAAPPADKIVAPPAAAIVTPAAAADMVQLALRYEHGEGVPRDFLHAASLYCSAARAGNADAMYELGWMYANGRGLPIDAGFAARLFKLAADAGHTHAGALVEKIPLTGETGVPPCLSIAPEPKAAAVTAEDAAPARDLRNVSGAKIHKLVTRLAPRYQIDPDLVMAIIYMESGFNERARSPKNAQGLMQLIPDTAQRFNVKNPYDAEDNIKGGLSYLRWLLAYFEGNVALVAAAYNAGEGAVLRFKGVPPYPETKAYVAKLAGLYKRTLHPYNAERASGTAGIQTTQLRVSGTIKLSK